MGYVVVSPCLPSLNDATNYASPLQPGFQVLSCTSTSSFVELTPTQKSDLFFEGMQLGGAVAVVWAIVWSFTIIRRAI